MKANKSADTLSEEARAVSRLCNLWLEHPAAAHQAHERAVSAHESESGGFNKEDRERHQRLAKEHRSSAEYWAKKESDLGYISGVRGIKN